MTPWPALLILAHLRHVRVPAGEQDLWHELRGPESPLVPPNGDLRISAAGPGGRDHWPGVPPAGRVWNPVNLQMCDPSRPTTAVSGGPGRRRWEFMRLPGESVDELNTEATAWRLLASWDLNPGNCRLELHAVYTFEARWAQRQADGGAGPAAGVPGLQARVTYRGRTALADDAVAGLPQQLGPPALP